MARVVRKATTGFARWMNNFGKTAITIAWNSWNSDAPMAMYASLAQFRDLWPYRILGVAALVGRLQLVDEDFLFGALRFAR